MNNDLSAALVAFDSQELKSLLDQVTVNCDLTFGYHKGLRKVTLTDRRDKLTIVGYRSTLTEALSYVLDVWHNIETVDISARLFSSWENGSQPQELEAT